MKPFDLEKALSGAPVVTWEGKEVTQLTLFDIDESLSSYPLVGVIEYKGLKVLEHFMKDGSYFVSGNVQQFYTLYMKD